MSYCVYCHTNIKNGKRYIGITSQKPEQRWQKGRKYSNNLHFKRAIDECGWDGFLHKILYDNLSLNQAEQKEIELIKKYKCCDPEHGYKKACNGKLKTAGKLHWRFAEGVQ